MTTTSSPLNIAFQNLCKRDWIAGCNYLFNLFTAIGQVEHPPRSFLLNLSSDSDDSDDSDKQLKPLVSDLIHAPVKRPFFARAQYRLQTKLNLPLGAMNPIEYGLRQSKIDVLFTGKGMGKDFKLPTMMWIPDFQHLHLPHLFSPTDRQQRTKRYQEWIAQAQTVVVSSQSALQDIETFAPQHLSKVRVLKFVAQVDNAIYDRDPLQIAKKYHLPERFFYLPNQFWQHKNHGVVIQALSLIKHTHPHIGVVCSGNTSDYRQPHYFNEVLELIATHGVHQQFRILGMIPFLDIFALIRQSVAVLQPSLFEGWSTTVEETKSVGKTLILSDIPVHREQNPPKAHYFKPTDAEMLAQILIHVDKQNSGGVDVELEKQAKENLTPRLKAFGETFMTIVQDTLGGDIARAR
jgi:glycosyltransferase involved in cell wall biosynthesis